jgi:hypothetical protein
LALMNQLGDRRSLLSRSGTLPSESSHICETDFHVQISLRLGLLRERGNRPQLPCRRDGKSGRTRLRETIDDEMKTSEPSSDL